jgi:ribose-phosphate pyrophosphokinase
MHFALIDKRRYAPNKAEVVNLVGDLENRDVIIIDDMIDTAGTTVNAAEKAIENGARSVVGVATHALLSGEAIERLKNSPIKQFIFTDTVYVPEGKILPNMRFVTVAGVFGEAIRRIYEGESVSALFKF